MIKVKDMDGLVRDPTSNCILKTDLSELERFKTNKNSDLKLHNLTNKVNVLESKLSNIEILLQQISNKL